MILGNHLYFDFIKIYNFRNFNFDLVILILNQIFNYLYQSYMHYDHFITIKLDITYFKSKNYHFTFILIIIIIIDFLQFIYF